MPLDDHELLINSIFAKELSAVDCSQEGAMLAYLGVGHAALSVPMRGKMQVWVPVLRRTARRRARKGRGGTQAYSPPLFAWRDAIMNIQQF